MHGPLRVVSRSISYCRIEAAAVLDAKGRLSAFLFEHLGEYGDPLEHIEACLDYVIDPGRGGAVFVAECGGELAGVVVLNATGMSGYIPEFILVYIAVDGELRGRGVGAELMRLALSSVHGAVALHVEPHNPARRLYERLGFESKYLEMRIEQNRLA